MDIELSGEQRLFHETVRTFLEREAPLAATRERASRGEPPLPPGYWSRAAELGLAAMLIPEKYGGVGNEDPVLDLIIAAEELGRQAAPGPLLPGAVVADALARSGTAGQQAAFLPPLADGSLIATWASGEAPDRWEPDEAETRAVPDRGEWVLHGAKFSVEAADVAGLFLVTARTGRGMAQFLVPRDAPGLSVTALPGYDLGRAFGSVELDGVRVPASAVLGEPGAVSRDLERQYLLALTLQAAETAGLTGRVFEMTLQYTRERYAFGRPLASYQALKHRIADHKMWLEAALGLSTALARAYAAEAASTAKLASVTKAHLGDQSLTIISDCAQLFGGIAMTWEHDLHLYLRRATVNKFHYGSPAQHRERLCRLAGL